MIENIGFIRAARTGGPLGGEGGGEIHRPEHQSRRGEVDTASAHDAEDLSTVQGEVARVHGHAKPRDAGEAAGAGHIVQASARVEVVATAGASSNRCAAAMAAVGQNVTAGADNQGHSIRVGPAVEWLEKKSCPRRYEGNLIFSRNGRTEEARPNRSAGSRDNSTCPKRRDKCATGGNQSRD